MLRGAGYAIISSTMVARPSTLALMFNLSLLGQPAHIL